MTKQIVGSGRMKNDPSKLHVLELGTQLGVGGITRHILALARLAGKSRS
jgi:hypothetical protein